MKALRAIKKSPWSVIMLGTLMAMAVCLLFLLGVFEYPELGILDIRYRLKAEANPHPDIVIVGITERCLNRLGRFPWPRTYHAELIDFLKKAGAKVIAVDIFFAQRDQDPLVDRRLAEAIKDAGCVILPVFMPHRIFPDKQPAALADSKGPDNPVKVDYLIESTEDIKEGALSQGHINMLPDADGIYRKALVAIEYSKKTFFCLGAEAAMRFQGIQPGEVAWGEDYIRLKDKTIPLEDSRFAYINFSDIEAKSPRFAFSDVVKGIVPAENFKGKLVFVGQTTQGLPNADILQTPFKEKYGVTIQANIANTFLADFYFKRQAKFKVCAGVVLVSIITVFAVVYINAWLAAIFVLSELAMLWLASVNAFVSKGIITEFFPLGSSVIFGFAAGVLYHLRFADRETAVLSRQVNELFLSSIKALAQTIDAKDPYTHGHSERVTKTALAIADQMGLDKGQRREIMVGAILHDIGKIGIKDAILSKPGQLTEEEKSVFDQHPHIGSKIMSHIKRLENVIPIIRHHHESYDGAGYPDGLKAGQIPLGARIIAVADTFDAMASDRPYRKALSSDVARQEINKLSGKQFDPEVVKAFNSAYDKGIVLLPR